MTTKETIENLKGKSLIDTNPELCKEWHYEKNGKRLPEMFTKGSSKKVWWLCAKGHEWQATIATRNKGAGCPYCKNIKVLQGYNDFATTNPELTKEWNYEKNVDFLPTLLTRSSAKKVWWKCSKGHEWKAAISNRNAGAGCPFCAKSNPKVLQGFNDLAITNPSLAKEWNYEKNGELLPTQVLQNSGKKVWWKCKKNHEWQARIQTRNQGKGCPYCSGRYAIQGENDLATTNPNLAKEWNYEKNGDLKPTQVVTGSAISVWWKCKCGHEWTARVVKRNSGTGCPYCKGRKNGNNK